jgi:oligoribonuclease NrnB/cAMP/cGMP phosphodiesterase (DHH superfamily)
MDEYNITQTTKNDQVFFSKIRTGSTIARISEYAKFNKKLSELRKDHDIWRWTSNSSHINVAGLSRLTGSQPLADNWISNDNTNINKYTV